MEFFIENAISSVWCSPNSNMQSIIEPARLTPNGGAWNDFALPWRVVTLPEQGPNFHIYMIGQIHPYLIGLLQATEHWVTFATACNKRKMIIDVYANSGVQMPRTQCWYMVTKDKDLIVAVKQQTTIPISFDEALFMRFYTNAFFQTPAGEITGNTVKVAGGPMATTAAIIALQQQYNACVALTQGLTYAFVNGMLVNNISLSTVSPGDVAEFVYDGSIYKQLSFTIGNLLSFQSTLDSKFKYLLHYPSLDNSEGIEFEGDIDLWLTLPGTGGKYEGVYYHRNQPDAVRMLTHKDYSIPVPYVVGYASDQATWTNPNALVVLLNVRHSGYTRTLPDEANRIKTLYKLSDSEVLAAMIGVNAVVPNWQAATLEAAAYPQLMNASFSDITTTLVQNAYGYNALSKILGNTPSNVTPYSNLLIVSTPPGLVGSSMAYEYDSNGLLLGYHQNTTGLTYTTNSSSAAKVEMIAGTGGVTLDETYDTHTQYLDPTWDYRMYTCPLSNGQPTNVWTDVTNTGSYGIGQNDLLTWNVDFTQTYTMVRSNKNFLAYSLDVPVTSGLLTIALTSTQTRGGSTASRALQIQMGDIDVFLNGHSLIENLDYFVTFPIITIVNKQFLVNPNSQTQHVDIRATGFCKSDMTRSVTQNTGFIMYGLIDYKGPVFERGDRVTRAVIGGALVSRDQYQTSEDNSGSTTPNPMNGLPYSIRDVIVPLRGTVPEDTYTLKAIAKTTDIAVDNYLTANLSRPLYEGPDTITNFYRLYSPFFCKILVDLVTNVIDNTLIHQTYSSQTVSDICEPYQYLLAVDPTQSGLAPDPNFVKVDPHNLPGVVPVNIYQYKFLNLVIQTFMPGAFSLSQFFSITTAA